MHTSPQTFAPQASKRLDTAVRSTAGSAVPLDAREVTSLQAARLTKMGIPMKPKAFMKLSPMSESAAQREGDQRSAQ